jgi:hypothetical protein
MRAWMQKKAPALPKNSNPMQQTARPLPSTGATTRYCHCLIKVESKRDDALTRTDPFVLQNQSI